MAGTRFGKSSDARLQPLTRRFELGVQFLPRIFEFSGRRIAMPTYEYSCKDCHFIFEKILTLAAHDEQPVTCPKCGGANVSQDFTPFYPITSKKSA
jgi:putative FmdB family regulatory protein